MPGRPVQNGERDLWRWSRGPAGLPDLHIAGGCAKVANCARTCQQASDCAAEQSACADGVCQVVGCSCLIDVTSARPVTDPHKTLLCSCRYRRRIVNFSAGPAGVRHESAP